MKVLLTATVQSHICQFHRPLVQMLREHGCEVHVAARDNLAEKNGLKLDFADRAYDIPFARSPRSRENLRAYRELREILEVENYDVIHCNTPMGGIVTRLAARRARKSGAKVYYTAHGFHFYQGAPKKNWVIFYTAEKVFSKLTDKIITITEEDYHLAERKFGCRAEYIHGVGVDHKRYFPVSEEEKQGLRERLGIGTERKIILCVGELLPNKNQKMAVSAMKIITDHYPEALLLLAGNGPQRDELQGYISACGLEAHVRMLGYVTNLQEFQQMADVAVSCSRREGLPLNVVEAMLSGTPVVASENRGHRELIVNGRTGYLVKPEDDRSMAARVLELLGDAGLYRRIQRQAREDVGVYTSENVKHELGKVYGY